MKNRAMVLLYTCTIGVLPTVNSIPNKSQHTKIIPINKIKLLIDKITIYSLKSYIKYLLPMIIYTEMF